MSLVCGEKIGIGLRMLHLLSSTTVHELGFSGLSRATFRTVNDKVSYRLVMVLSSIVALEICLGSNRLRVEDKLLPDHRHLPDYNCSTPFQVHQWCASLLRLLLFVGWLSRRHAILSIDRLLI